MNSFILWNLQSYHTKTNELKTILNKRHPACVCLQETLIGHRQAFSPSQYNIVTSPVKRADGHERGTAILINQIIQHEIVPLRTELQAVAVKHLFTIFTTH